jgi:hypothetical protein
VVWVVWVGWVGGWGWIGLDWGKNLSYYLEMSQEMSILAFARQTFKK